MKPSTYPNFDGLLDLARRDGVDIRPTLLRVITDTYLQSATHAPEDERQYTELALRLIDESDIAGRAAIAARLAHYPATPRPIILQLARDVLDVAEPILKHSPVLTPADREAIIRERGPLYAKLIAERERPPESSANAATATPHAPANTNSDAVELCELFFAAGGPERRSILLNLDYAATEPVEPPAPLQRADVWRLETAALRHETDVVTRELQRALGVSIRQARRIVDDELGEPIVAAAKAMQLPADVLQRLLLFINSKVGQSVDRVYELATLYREISVEAARRLIDILRQADPAEHKPGRHEALPWHHAAENARRALSEISRPASEQAPRRDMIRTR